MKITRNLFNKRYKLVISVKNHKVLFYNGEENL